MNSLRMEKAYRAWGLELTNEVTMIEGAMERFVDLAKDFVGKAGTLKSKEDGPRIQLVYLEVAATDPTAAATSPSIMTAASSASPPAAPMGMRSEVAGLRLCRAGAGDEHGRARGRAWRALRGADHSGAGL